MDGHDNQDDIDNQGDRWQEDTYGQEEEDNVDIEGKPFMQMSSLPKTMHKRGGSKAFRRKYTQKDKDKLICKGWKEIGQDPKIGAEQKGSQVICPKFREQYAAQKRRMEGRRPSLSMVKERIGRGGRSTPSWMTNVMRRHSPCKKVCKGFMTQKEAREKRKRQERREANEGLHQDTKEETRDRRERPKEESRDRRERPKTESLISRRVQKQKLEIEESIANTKAKDVRLKLMTKGVEIMTVDLSKMS